MHLHLPHLTARQRILLRGLVGAFLGCVALFLALLLMWLIALLLVYPEKAFGYKTPCQPVGAATTLVRFHALQCGLSEPDIFI